MNPARPFLDGTSRTLLLALAMLLCMGIPSCPDAAAESDTVRIGIYLPMTGPLSAQGQAEYAGITAAHRMKPKVLGRTVELFPVDTGAEQTGTAGVATRLINEQKVHAMIGEPSGGDGFAGITAAEKARIPTVIPVSARPSATGHARYAFHTGLTPFLEARAAARYASSRLKAGKAAVLMNIERDYSIDLANLFVKSVTDAGGRIVSVAYCRTSDEIFITQLSAITAAKADVLYLPVSSGELARICRQSVDMGINTHIISSRNAHAPGLISAGGEYVDGVILTSDFEREDTPGEASILLDTYEKESGAPAGRFDVLGADAYLLLTDAMERAGSTEGPKIRQALAATRGFRGISGVMDMDKEGNAIKGVVMVQIKGGRFRSLETLTPGVETAEVKAEKEQGTLPAER